MRKKRFSDTGVAVKEEIFKRRAEIADERLGELPGAEEIFKAGDEECAALLAELTPVRLAAGRLKTLEADTGETLGGEFGALFDWLAACLERGSVEEYEFRVSCY